MIQHSLLGAASAGVAILASAPASAADTGALTVSGGAAVVSDYRFRGISLSDEDPAIQASLEVEHRSGLYAGAWGSTIDDAPPYGALELDLYAGYRFEPTPGTKADVGIVYYIYPNGGGALGPAHYFEPFAKLSHQIGPVEATAGVAYAWRQAALGDDDNLYLWTDLGAGVPGTPITLKGHVGYSNGSLAPGGSYWDWSIGAEVAAGPATFGIAYVDNNLGRGPNIGGGVVVSLGLAF
jgi:uncharacterized protein (TIGR02001 family)